MTSNMDIFKYSSYLQLLRPHFRGLPDLGGSFASPKTDAQNPRRSQETGGSVEGTRHETKHYSFENDPHEISYKLEIYNGCISYITGINRISIHIVYRFIIDIICLHHI